MSLACGDKCLKTFREDDLTRSETTCLVNCYTKHYRFLAYASTLYTYIVSGEQVDGHIRENYEDFIGMDDDKEETVSQPVNEGIPVASTVNKK